ncbi:MAG: Spy/CpxP family protein refolding chaperone [Bacteroidales bacterium]|nr:Spy/CpxP family protein refolding chaperone [Bacteroidales bacterium]
MKARNFLVIALVFFFALNLDAFGQRGPRGIQDGACLNIPELTQEQEAKIQAIRTERINQTTAHRAQMDELRARQRTLRLAENPNMAEIDKVIDQMASLRAEHMKANAAHQQSIRELLTPEQRVLFDSRTANRPRFEQRNMGRSDAGRGHGRFQDNAPRGRRR